MSADERFREIQRLAALDPGTYRAAEVAAGLRCGVYRPREPYPEAAARRSRDRAVRVCSREWDRLVRLREARIQWERSGGGDWEEVLDAGPPYGTQPAPGGVFYTPWDRYQLAVNLAWAYARLFVAWAGPSRSRWREWNAVGSVAYREPSRPKRYGISLTRAVAKIEVWMEKHRADVERIREVVARHRGAPNYQDAY